MRGAREAENPQRRKTVREERRVERKRGVKGDV